MHFKHLITTAWENIVFSSKILTELHTGINSLQNNVCLFLRMKS